MIEKLHEHLIKEIDEQGNQHIIGTRLPGPAEMIKTINALVVVVNDLYIRIKELEKNDK